MGMPELIRKIQKNSENAEDMHSPLVQRRAAVQLVPSIIPPKKFEIYKENREYRQALKIPELRHLLYGVFEPGERLTEDRAGDGDIESLKSRAACSEHGAAVQPEFRPPGHETVQFRRAQTELRTIHPGKIGPLRLDQL